MFTLSQYTRIVKQLTRLWVIGTPSLWKTKTNGGKKTMSTNRLVFSPNLTKVTQGDVLLRRVRIPKAAEKFEQTDRTLAYGEATGHSHTLTGGEVEFLKWQGKTYLRVLKECTLEHLKNFKTPTGEHNPIVF